MKWAIREAVDVYFKPESTFKLGARTIRAGEPALIFDTVKTSTLEVGSEVSYVTGGRGNSRILSYEGDKTLAFSFEEALLSAEGLAILSGAELIPARNKYLDGAAPEARSVIAHYTEKAVCSVINERDNYDGTNGRNKYYDPSLGTDVPARGSRDNIWFTRKPYVGNNSSIYVMLLDKAGEISGAPIEINLRTDDVTPSGDGAERHKSSTYLRKFHAEDCFIAFDKSGNPIEKKKDTSTTTGTKYLDPKGKEAAIFDDGVAYYVDKDSALNHWTSAWGDKPEDIDETHKAEASQYIRQIPAEATYASDWNTNAASAAYCYLLAPSGGVAQPKCFREDNKFVYKANVSSILYQDIVLLDYYVEYRHNATQVSILPDKFAPYMYVEGSSLVKRASDGMDLPVEFVIPKLKITTALTFTLQSTGDASTFNFAGDAYPGYTKFDMTRKVLADIIILDADDNYDLTGGEAVGDPTSYRRYQYNEDVDGDYLWKDPSIADHANIDYSDAYYEPTHGGPASVNMDAANHGNIYH